MKIDHRNGSAGGPAKGEAMKRKSILVAAVVLALGVSGTAFADARGERPVSVSVGDLELTVGGDVSPTTLPKTELAPIGLHAEGKLASLDGSPLPPLERIVLDSSRGGVVNAVGLPACSYDKLRATSTEAAVKACPEAIVGRGKAEVEVAFPEQAPFDAVGPIVFFNGGVRGGTTTIYAHAYVSVPAPTAVIVTVKATKENDGPYGLHTVATVPLIAGGAGAVKSFEVSIHRLFTYRGEKESFLEARCEEGRFLAKVEFALRDGDKLAGSVIRRCQVAS
jgi:hypothetical protein